MVKDHKLMRKNFRIFQIGFSISLKNNTKICTKLCFFSRKKMISTDFCGSKTLNQMQIKNMSLRLPG